MDNRHTERIPPEVLKEAQENIDRVNAILKPYLIILTPEERHDFPKMGRKSLEFGEKTLDYSRQYPQINPPYLDRPGFEEDMADAVGLRVLQTSAQQLADNIDDTSLIAGSEAYQAALLFYSAVKDAADHNVPGAKEVYNDLKTRFPGRKRKKKEDEEV
jgi:hypothetical protein